MAFGQLRYGSVFVLAHDRSQVNEGRNIPAVRLVEQDVFRRRRDELCTAHDVCDLHEMVIDDIGKVISWHAVAFQQNLILKFAVRDRDVAMQHIEEGRIAIEWHLLADDIRIAILDVRIDYVLRQVAAGTVIAAELAGRMILFRIAEAIVSMAALDQLFGIFLVEVHALTLHIRTVATAESRALVRDDVCHLERAVDEVDSIRDITGTVSIFDTQDEVTFLGLGIEVAIECSTQVADVHVSRRAWSETGTNFLISQLLFLLFIVGCFHTNEKILLCEYTTIWENRKAFPVKGRRSFGFSQCFRNW